MKRTAYPVPLALMGALALAGCSGTGQSEGVIIDGTGYSVEEVQEAAAQMGEISPEPADVRRVIYEAGVAPILAEAFAGTPAEVTESELRSSLADAGLTEEASDLTLQAATFRHYGTLLGDQAALSDPALADAVAALQAVTVEDLAALPVEVNPRFGTWDPAGQGVVPEVPAWIQQPGS